MAVLVEWRGIPMPPCVRLALVKQWRGQEGLGKAAKEVLAFFSDAPKFVDQATLGEAVVPEALTPQQNVKTVLRLKAEGEGAQAHEISFARINPSKLLDLVLKSKAVPDEQKRVLCEGRAAAVAKKWLEEHAPPKFEDLPAAEAALARAEEDQAPEYDLPRRKRQSTLRERFVQQTRTRRRRRRRRGSEARDARGHGLGARPSQLRFFFYYCVTSGHVQAPSSSHHTSQNSCFPILPGTGCQITGNYRGNGNYLGNFR